MVFISRKDIQLSHNDILMNEGICCCSVAKLYLTHCDPMNCSAQAFLFSTISGTLLKFMSIESVMLSNHLILCHPFSFWLQSFPASRSFPMIQLFDSDGQRIGASVSATVLPMNIQDWFPLGLTGLILQSKGFSRVCSSTTIQKRQFFSIHSSLWFNSHIHTWPLDKPQLWLYGPLLAKWYLYFLICCLALS